MENNQTNTYMEETNSELVHTYNRFPVVLDHGEGVYLYDTEGKKYLDFAAGIAVCGLGYSNEEYKTALKNQIDLLTHTSNLYYNTTCGKAAKALLKACEMDKVFFTNSGTEAIEGALKAARKYAYKKGTGRYEFIAMEDSFHGRSMGALSVTGTEHYRTPFEPLIPGVKFAKYNDLDSVKALVSDKTCAIILEALQGEGGITPATDEFMKGLRQICDEEGILLICDEIQCGMGRTGSMFAWQGYGVKPDIMTCAKALGCGVPVGAFLLTEKVAQNSLKAGDHGTTYGGNPFACAAVSKMIDLFEENKIVEHVQEITPYFEEKLEERKTEIHASVLEAKLAAEAVDVTIPGTAVAVGHQHPMNQVLQQIKDVFVGLGYQVVEGPEVELADYNFTRLNIEEGHPSRDRSDTFYFTDDDSVLLRTQTSPMQIRYMENHKPPLCMLAPGRVFRKDEADATHSPMFHQIEGLVVDEHITMGDLKGALITIMRKLYGEDAQMRFRPHHFPFTEPSCEMDMQCHKCHGTGEVNGQVCSTCHGEGWIELLGAGMVHPKVLESCGIDSEKYTGFAFGMGLERLAMGRLKINDLRLIFDNDVRFLNQF